MRRMIGFIVLVLSGDTAAQAADNDFPIAGPYLQNRPCQGDGTVTVEMQFLADVELPCEECGGTRYKSTVLDIKYKGKNIHDVLCMTVREALSYFAGIPRIVDKLAVLEASYEPPAPLDDDVHGTLVAIHAVGAPGGFFGWATPFMAKMVRRSIRADLHRLRECLEPQPR